MKKRIKQPKGTPLDEFLKTHKSTCAVHIYSGDGHCSCGRDEALKELAQLRARPLEDSPWETDIRRCVAVTLADDGLDDSVIGSLP